MEVQGTDNYILIQCILYTQIIHTINISLSPSEYHTGFRITLTLDIMSKTRRTSIVLQMMFLNLLSNTQFINNKYRTDKKYMRHRMCLKKLNRNLSDQTNETRLVLMIICI